MTGFIFGLLLGLFALPIGFLIVVVSLLLGDAILFAFGLTYACHRAIAINKMPPSSFLDYAYEFPKIVLHRLFGQWFNTASVSFSGGHVWTPYFNFVRSSDELVD